ncbi:MAG TPA: hypothetical protein DEB09_01940 [Candidatus Magasanikbacteria bacterium]|nr:hypothetical protein [Candidatus Magasanikbacteria bacterium]
MKPSLSPSGHSVFEMILQSAGEGPATVMAKPSDFKLPDNWHEQHQEGQLAVDVAQNEKEIIVVSTMAGADTEKIEVYVHNDLLTIRGQRVSPIVHETRDEYFHAECFWGRFSRTVVLPLDVKGDLARAEYKNGVLVVRIPKQIINTKIQVTIVEE